MSTFSQLYCHLVFSTKNREPHIHKHWRDNLHAYMAGICQNLGSMSQYVGGVEDHVHLLIVLPNTMCIADFVKHLKRASTKWIQEEQKVSDFLWQEGYGAFSVSPSAIEQVKAYINTQEEHHKVMSFVDEYKRLLAKIGLSCYERFFP